MPIRVSIVELYTHHEVVNVVCKLINSLSHQIDLYLSKRVWENCQDLYDLDGLSFIVQEEDESKIRFIQQHEKQINESQLIIFTTLVDELRPFSRMSFRPPSLLLVHNGHSFFAPYSNIVISKTWGEIWLDLLRLLHQLIFRIPFWRRKLLKSMSCITVASGEMKNYLEEYCPERLLEYQILPPLPLAFFECDFSPETRNTDAITITIPGSVNLISKHYDWIVQAFSELVNSQKRELNLILLGSAGTTTGKAVINRLQELRRNHLTITFFDTTVPQEKFDAIMSQTDFLILPMRPYLKLGICRERYGYSNISGGINDMIRFGIPALVPKYYPLPTALEGLVDTYENAKDLSRLLDQWIEDLPFVELRDRASDVLSVYEKTVVMQRTALLLEQMLSLNVKDI